MTKPFDEAYLDSTDVLRDIADHDTEWRDKGIDVLTGSKSTEALHYTTIMGKKYHEAADMNLEFAMRSHMAIRGVSLDDHPDQENIHPKYYQGARETYDLLNHHVDAIGALVQSHSWSLGQQHPLTQHIVKGYQKKQKLVSKYAKAWGFKDRFDFDDIMKNNNLNPDQFK
jgi:hypothetical protein